MSNRYSYQELVAINNAVDESVNSFVREQAEKDLRKEILERMKDEFEMSKEELILFKNAVVERYKENITEKVTILEESLAFNDSLLEAEMKLRSVSAANG
jgi:hypothetical protein